MSMAKKFLSSAGGAAGNTLTNSLQFDRADSAYLSRTMSSSNRDLWTFSTWIKRLNTGVFHHIYTAALDSDDFTYISFQANNTIAVSSSKNGSTAAYIYTTPTYGAGSWFHLTVVWDLSLTASSRVVIYVNGTIQTTTVSTAASASVSDHYINSGNPHRLGVRDRAGSRDNYLDALLADVIFVDNQALLPSNFGYDNGGSWEWKDYTGTFGSNGFRLLFDDGTSTTTLGYDNSSNGNNWALNNLATSDQKTDIPA